MKQLRTPDKQTNMPRQNIWGLSTRRIVAVCLGRGGACRDTTNNRVTGKQFNRSEKWLMLFASLGIEKGKNKSSDTAWVNYTKRRKKNPHLNMFVWSGFSSCFIESISDPKCRCVCACVCIRMFERFWLSVMLTQCEEAAPSRKLSPIHLP